MYCLSVPNMACSSSFVLHVGIYSIINFSTASATTQVVTTLGSNKDPRKLKEHVLLILLFFIDFCKD